ncbi:LamG-like jellyroll fold domain-containing protein [Colwellia sp. UCD-KL20]|uniref:LamG-like jellyroll fold domain-containing protein n=1 Tax=Colwellia sp. UCD-KL20 TaxID=1917165 RepID=UPI0009710066|nr:LamG-like jellyroll fold domain-containing protein [Colwellia sp. UCD-KL20]
MNSHYDELIAAYLAGDDVEQALIKACEDDETLLAELSQQVAFSRVVAFALYAKNDQMFIDSFKSKLANEVNTQVIIAKTNNIQEITSNKATVIPTLFKGNLWQRYAIAACIALFSFLFIFYQYSYSPSLGLIAKVVEAESQKGMVYSGDNVAHGQFSLTKGYAEITLNNGVALLLEAPIRLNISSVEHITLVEGSLVAYVPDGAEGFQVDTPSSQIIDLGTEFGVSVDKKGKSQVHVLKGEVKVRASKKQEYEHLTVDQARSFDLDQQVAIIKSQPHRFMRTLPGKSIQDPDYLHWSLDRQKGANLPCQGKGINGQCFDAQRKSLIEGKVGPEFVQGKFGDAIYFNGEDDWLDTAYSGIGGNKPRTVAFWVKIPENFSAENSFGILSWGLMDKLAAWQISPNPNGDIGPIGRIRVGISHAVVVGTTDLRDSQWHHVAIVLFGGTNVNLSTHVLMYVDGKLEKTATKSIAKVLTDLDHPKSKPFAMGRNIAFNTNKNQKYKFFKGWLDEVYLFDSALTQKSIYNLMTFNQLTPNPKELNNKK